MMRSTIRKGLVAAAAGVVVFVAGDAVPAKQHGHEGRDEEHGRHSDRGKHYAKGHHKFDARDRDVARSWCAENREHLPVGLRPGDRLSSDLEVRLRIGSVLDGALSQRVAPLPPDLVRRLPPPPVDLRYVAIGGHVALLDAAHRLHDLLPLPPLPF